MLPAQFLPNGKVTLGNPSVTLKSGKINQRISRHIYADKTHSPARQGCILRPAFHDMFGDNWTGGARMPPTTG